MANKKQTNQWKKSKAFSELTTQEQLWAKTGYALSRLFDPTQVDENHGPHTITVKQSATETLIVLKARTGEGPQIAFTGSSDPLKAVRKAYGEWDRGELKWRLDEWEAAKFAQEDEDW